jgi:hypothetical protein
MMFPPCPPWAGWYGPWVPPPMHFYSGWSGPTQGFGHGGYYAGDGCYGHIGPQQGREASGQKNRIVQNEPPVDHLGDGQEKTGPENKSSANDEVESDAGKSLEEAAAEQSKVPRVKTKTGTKAGTSSQIIQFCKPDYPIFAASSQKQPSKTTVPGIAPAPRLCPSGLTPSQRRRIQRMRA